MAYVHWTIAIVEVCWIFPNWFQFDRLWEQTIQVLSKTFIHWFSCPLIFLDFSWLRFVRQNSSFSTLFAAKMEPHERARYTFHNLLRRLLIVIGHNFIKEGGFKPNLFTFFLYALNVFGSVSCIYTVLWYDFETALNSIGYGAVNIQVTYK